MNVLVRRFCSLPAIQIGIIGRPNAGKSSLLNALVKSDAAIVDDAAGTTTDSIAVNWNYQNHTLRIVDTAGVTKGWKRGNVADTSDPGMETLKTVSGSHVCVLLLDATEVFRSPNNFKFPSRQEVKLGNEVIDSGKCLVVAVNKWDMVPESEKKNFKKNLINCIETSFYEIKGVPILFVSAKDGGNLTNLLSHTLSVYRKWDSRVNASKLNEWLSAFVLRNPPPWKDGQKQYPKFIAQTRTRPPTFALYTNTFATFPENYLRQIQELLKEEFDLKGVPVRINLRSTLMPKPGARIRDRDVSRWTKLGPKQAAAVKRIRNARNTQLDNKLD
jgi:GTPase